MIDDGTGMGIFYLDGRNDSSVRRALKKYGRVDYARDIDEALPLLVENEYSYFFIDADSPMAQVFIKHLRHDPHIAKPSVIVLITENDEEDCEAWLVDTYIKRTRFAKNVPYIFSHLKPEPETGGNVVRIAADTSVETNGGIDLLKKRARARSSGIRSRRRFRRVKNQVGGFQWESERSSNRLRTCASCHSRQDASLDNLEVHETPGDEPDTDRKDDILLTCEVSSSHMKVRRGAVLVCACIVAGVALWLLTVGPLSGSSSKRSKSDHVSSVKSYSRKRGTSNENPLPVSVEQYSSRNSVSGDQSQHQAGYEGKSDGVGQIQDSQPDSEAPGENNRSGVDVQRRGTPSDNEDKTAVNRPPVVSVSGPTQVLRRQTVVYTAVAYDPDGDSILYSWGGNTKSRNWSTPGIYQVSVTVTDCRGLSTSAALTVRVI